MSVGPLEIAILVVILFLVFGVKRLPELGSSVGGAIRGFGKGIKGEDEPVAEVEQPAVETAKSSDASPRSGS
jgi:TatA/E family protein of Tat protein translocase